MFSELKAGKLPDFKKHLNQYDVIHLDIQWPIEEYTKEQLHMFDVRPGFSGWAQIHGRKDVEWNHRIELNVWYVKHVRFSLDLRIFLTTIFKVLLNKDNENKGETLKK